MTPVKMVLQIIVSRSMRAFQGDGSSLTILGFGHVNYSGSFKPKPLWMGCLDPLGPYPPNSPPPRSYFRKVEMGSRFLHLELGGTLSPFWDKTGNCTSRRPIVNQLVQWTRQHTPSVCVVAFKISDDSDGLTLCLPRRVWREMIARIYCNWAVTINDPHAYKYYP